MPSPRSHVEHLWIVLTERSSINESVCANVTDEAKIIDKTTILIPGDHPFIKKKSAINYQSAKIVRLDLVESSLEEEIWGSTCKIHHPCSAELIKRIQAGLLASIHTTKAIKSLCRESWDRP
jgi:hypothetical protein